MDKIEITALEIYAYHGVYEEEKKNGQRFYLDLTLEIERSDSADDIGATVHYGEVAIAAQRYATQTRYDLIETLAEGVARTVLDSFAAVRAVEVAVNKPDAPIPLTFGNVCVKIRRVRTAAYLALGSNLGDKKAYLDGAIAALRDIDGVRVAAVSSYYVTPPYGVVDQDDFVNACVKIETYLSPRDLLGVCRRLEQAAGRVRLRRWGERTLDIDIVGYGDAIVDEPDLQIPHREMHKRAFVLDPLSEIASGWVHPILRKTVSMLREEVHG